MLWLYLIKTNSAEYTAFENLTFYSQKKGGYIIWAFSDEKAHTYLDYGLSTDMSQAVHYRYSQAWNFCGGIRPTHRKN